MSETELERAARKWADEVEFEDDTAATSAQRLVCYYGFIAGAKWATQPTPTQVIEKHFGPHDT